MSTHVDVSDVERVLAAYTSLGDSGRVEDLAALFGHDGTLEVAGLALEGPAAIAGFLRTMGREMAGAGGLLPGYHLIGRRRVEVHGPAAAISSSTFVFMAPGGPDHWGTYRDDLTRDEDGWRFVKRSVGFDGFTDSSTARSIVDGVRARARDDRGRRDGPSSADPVRRR
ncbi:nuclear transport factor 2 family protein [Arsenicicoccus bolidensis]|uniref:nuclear transport factor 2 family protein n=1 Tax=Arsenicicoccus bolidensis TaxID=229480 RepID=UPI0028B05CD2|nr:nuclear transport factor 2 family protein [Arsenicicoccus bolidensis]